MAKKGVVFFHYMTDVDFKFQLVWKSDNFIRRFADYIANQTPVHL